MDGNHRKDSASREGRNRERALGSLIELNKPSAQSEVKEIQGAGSTLTLDPVALTPAPPHTHTRVHPHWSGKPAYRDTQPHGCQGRPQADKPGPGWGRRHAGGRRTPPASVHTLYSSHSHPAPGVPPVGTGVVSKDSYRVSGTAGHTPEETETSLSFDIREEMETLTTGHFRRCGILSLASASGRLVFSLTVPRCS